jgi:hypothetical protein
LLSGGGFNIDMTEADYSNSVESSWLDKNSTWSAVAVVGPWAQKLKPDVDSKLLKIVLK